MTCPPQLKRFMKHHGPLLLYNYIISISAVQCCPTRHSAASGSYVFGIANGGKLLLKDLFLCQATVPPEVKGAMTALQRCAKGSGQLVTWRD